jgi:hypothetical protein
MISMCVCVLLWLCWAVLDDDVRYAFTILAGRDNKYKRRGANDGAKEEKSDSPNPEVDVATLRQCLMTVGDKLTREQVSCHIIHYYHYHTIIISLSYSITTLLCYYKHVTYYHVTHMSICCIIMCTK